MNQGRLTELAALNAVGALDGAEQEELQQLLSSAAAPLRGNLGQFNEVAALIGVAQSPPLRAPEGLRAKVLQQVARPKWPSGASGFGPFYFINRDDDVWQTLPIPGVRFKELAQDPRRGLSVRLWDLAPGTRFPGHHHTGPEECYVLSGDFHVEGRVLHGGDFHHAEAESDHGESFTEGGCQLLVMVTAKDYS